MNIVIVQNNDPMTHTARKRKREEKRRKIGLSHGLSLSILYVNFLIYIFQVKLKINKVQIIKNH